MRTWRMVLSNLRAGVNMVGGIDYSDEYSFI